MKLLSKLLRTVLVSLLSSTVALVHAEDQLGRFGFQNVLLNMPFNAIPTLYKTDCSPGSNKRFVFCTHQTVVGSVTMTAEISIADDRVVEIHAYFPSSEFNNVWLALRQKYDKEDKREGQKIEWYSNSMPPDKLFPDELILLKTLEEPPRPDGKYYAAGVEYSVIHYQSYASARDGMRKRQEEQDRKIKGISEKL